jgi:hypothetical protein
VRLKSWFLYIGPVLLSSTVLLTASSTVLADASNITFDVVLDQSVEGRTGGNFGAHLVENLTVNDVRLLPANTKLVGEVLEPDLKYEHPNLRFDFSSVQLETGKSCEIVPLVKHGYWRILRNGTRLALPATLDSPRKNGKSTYWITTVFASQTKDVHLERGDVLPVQILEKNSTPLYYTSGCRF